ncbi:hypothetical protein ABZ345_44920 [Lentzea sp. NPDC005914]|uniref:hypothetical protein n=1 Tax=Lentzea sp. NPDC005914 TaxID=3154572 RepID=UPI0033F1250D
MRTALLTTIALMLCAVPAQAGPEVERFIEFSTQHRWGEQNVTFKGAVWRMSDDTYKVTGDLRSNCGGSRLGIKLEYSLMDEPWKSSPSRHCDDTGSFSSGALPIRKPQNIEVRVCVTTTPQANCGGHKYFAPWS